MQYNQVNEFENSSENDNKQLNETSAINTMSRVAKFALIIALVLGLGIWQIASLFGNFLHPQSKPQERGTVKTYTQADLKFEPPKIPEPPKKEEPAPEPEPEQVEEVKPEILPEPEPEPIPVAAEPQPASLLERRLASSGFEKSQAKTLPKSKVRVLDNPDFVILKGTKIPCVLETNVVSEQDGFVSCITNRDIYSSNSKILLIEKGSKITGEYSSSVKNSDKRLQIIWDRVVTPYNIVVDLNSPTTDRLGASGVTGKVDNRWTERIGSALLISLIDDALDVAKDKNTSENAEVIVDGNTTKTSQSMAEKILEKNIDLNPIIYLTEGKVLNIYVAEDIDFSSVYKLNKIQQRRGIPLIKRY